MFQLLLNCIASIEEHKNILEVQVQQASQAIQLNAPEEELMNVDQYEDNDMGKETLEGIYQRREVCLTSTSVKFAQ